MIWLALFAVMVIGVPLLMLGLASLSSYIGINQVVTGGLGAIVLFGSLPIPAAAIVSIVSIAVYLGYRLINKETGEIDHGKAST